MPIDSVIYRLTTDPPTLMPPPPMAPLVPSPLAHLRTNKSHFSPQQTSPQQISPLTILHHQFPLLCWIILISSMANCFHPLKGKEKQNKIQTWILLSSATAHFLTFLQSYLRKSLIPAVFSFSAFVIFFPHSPFYPNAFSANHQWLLDC